MCVEKVSCIQGEDLYNRWQEAKARHREEEHKLLKQKLVLQHKLIAAADTLSHQRQVDLVKKQAKERAVQRHLKRQKEEAIIKKGKESIARGKLKASNQPRNLKEPSNGNGESEGSRGTDDRQLLSAIPSREDEDSSSRSASMMSAGGDAPHRGTSREVPIEELVEGWDQLPLHKQELYRMFGPDEAECFLHRKMQPERKKVVQVPSSLRRLGGRSGANPLWQLLRDKSHLKLEYADSQIPMELKKAYSAYIREYLTHTKPGARRKFYSEKDLPPSERLEDSRYHEHIREIRHRMELMYRSSLANEDKTNILMHNNPMPDFNDLNGEEGIHRYHPSWADIEDDNDTEEELEYKKWLPPLENTKIQDEVTQQQQAKLSSDLNGLEETTRKQKHHKAHQGQKLTFLTEEDAKSEGQFWRNRRNPEVPQAIIPGHVIAESAAEGKGVDQRSIGNQGHVLPGGSNSFTSHSVMGGPRSLSSRAKWQPLTLSALGDHRPTVDIQASEDFRFGRPSTWKPVVASHSFVS